jgi:hypothetical protein
MGATESLQTPTVAIDTTRPSVPASEPAKASTGRAPVRFMVRCCSRMTKWPVLLSPHAVEEKAPNAFLAVVTGSEQNVRIRFP